MLASTFPRYSLPATRVRERPLSAELRLTNKSRYCLVKNRLVEPKHECFGFCREFMLVVG